MYSEFEDFVAFLFSREEMSVKIYTFENCVFEDKSLSNVKYMMDSNSRDFDVIRRIIEIQ